jgi:hypothetical protein
MTTVCLLGLARSRCNSARLNAKRKKRHSLDPTVPYVLVVGNHDPFCDDLELLLAVYGRDREAMVGKRPPLWRQQPQFAGFFGIGQDERPYHTRFAAVAVVGGSAPSSDPTDIQWLVFDNPHGRVRLPDGLLPANHRFQALSGPGWGGRRLFPFPERQVTMARHRSTDCWAPRLVICSGRLVLL